MLLIYSLFFGSWFFYNYKKYGFNVSSFLIFIYLVSSVAAVSLPLFFGKYTDRIISLESVLYLISCLFLCLQPIVYFGNKFSIVSRFPTNKVLDKITAALIPLVLVYILLQVSSAISVLKSDNLLYERMLVLNTETKPAGFLNYFEAIGASAVFILIILFFYYKIQKRSGLRMILLLICSLSPMIDSIANVSRSRAFSLIIYISFSILFFREFLKSYLTKKIKLIIGICIILILVFVYSITASRFSYTEEPIYVSIIDYWGQSFINFSREYDTFFNGIFWGRLNFAVLFPSSMQVANTNLTATYGLPYDVNVFSTFVGSFYLDFGIFTIIVCVIFNTLLNLILNTKFIKKYIIKFFIFTVYWHAWVLGVFYYLLSSRTEVLSFLSVALIIAFTYIKWPILKTKIYENY